MANFYFVPSWFFGFSLVLELIFAAITFAIALYALRIYNFCLERGCKLFGLGFLSLSASYFIWAVVSAYGVYLIEDPNTVVSLFNLSLLATFGVYAYVAFSLLGLVSLAYMSLNLRSQLVFTLLASLSFIAIIFSSSKIIAFYFVSSLLLFYVLIHYVKEYWQTKKNTSFLVLLAFVFLFLGSVDFTFSAVHHLHYVVGHILHLIGYIFALLGFIMTLKLSRK